ncbi:MAG: isoprenylcysteine carboxylmethyltransferase family protein [Chloroflexota bacterium]
MTETLLFRLIFAGIFLTAFVGAAVHRASAQMNGGRVSEASENRVLYVLLRGGGLALWLSFFLYIFYPRALAWSLFSLPVALRWFGVGMAAVAVPLAGWAARTIGNNVTRTVITRENHELVTTGPYRYIRHPLYTFGTMLFVGLGLIAASWFCCDCHRKKLAWKRILVSVTTPTVTAPAHFYHESGNKWGTISAQKDCCAGVPHAFTHPPYWCFHHAAGNCHGHPVCRALSTAGSYHRLPQRSAGPLRCRYTRLVPD